MANNAAHNELVRRGLEALAVAGYCSWKNETGVWFEYSIVNGELKRGRPHSYGKTGSADIIIVLAPHGRHVEAEAKTGTGKQKQNQKDHQFYCVERHGGAYILFRTVDELMAGVRALTLPENAAPHS